MSQGRAPCPPCPPPARWHQRANVVGMMLDALGFGPRDLVLLEVPGRSTGRLHRVAVVVARRRGDEFLVSLGGESQWVRNVRAADGRASLRRWRGRSVLLDELPVPQRPLVLRAWLDAAIGRSGLDVARQHATCWLGVPLGASVDELAAIAPDHPVFHVADRPADHGPGDDGPVPHDVVGLADGDPAA